MNCDLILKFGGSNFTVRLTSKDDVNESPDSLVIKVPKESEGPQSLDEIISLIRTQSDYFKTKMLNNLVGTEASLNYGKLLGNNNTVIPIGNCSFDTLKALYPQLMSVLPEDKEGGYNITLVNELKVQGEAPHGRIFINGVEAFLLFGEDDVRAFAIAEMKKGLVKQKVNGDEILEEEDRADLLKSRYGDKLQALLAVIKTKPEIVERIKKELNMEPTIESMLLDYLNYKQDYLKIFAKYNDSSIQGNVVMRDFVTDLNHDSIVYQDSETPLAAALRGLSVKREHFGKKGLYNVLKEYKPEVMESITEARFASLDADELTEILKEAFAGDVLLQNFRVVSVTPTNTEPSKINISTIKKLFKANIERMNAANPDGPKITASFEDLVKTVDDAYKYVGKTIQKDGETYPLQVRFVGGKPEFYITYTGLNDSDKIDIEYKGSILGEDFNLTDIGFETQNIVNPVDTTADDSKDPVTDGMYHGFYIYQASKNGEDVYIISQSPVSPSLYIRGQFKTLKDAKQQIISWNSSGRPYVGTMYSIKRLNGDASRGPIQDSPYVELGFPTKIGQVINSIDYYLPLYADQKLQAKEKELYYSGNKSKVINFYKENFNLDSDTKDKLSKVIDTPEKAGILLLAMADANLSAAEATTKESEEVSKVINVILDKIETSPIKQYIVRRSYSTGRKSADGRLIYNTFLEEVLDPINSRGISVNKVTPKQSLTASLHSLKNVINNTILSGTGIEIVITDNDSLLNDPEFQKDGVSIFGENPNPANINGFVYNNKIYINQSNISDATNTLYHEILHVTFGIIKAQDSANGTDNYHTLIKSFSPAV